MKYIFLSMFVLLSAQPFQASFCDMHESQETPHSAHEMPDGHMMDDGMAGMDCCDEPGASEGCESMFHCSACTPALPAITTSTFMAIAVIDSHQYFSDTDGSVDVYTPPPFRPPIS